MAGETDTRLTFDGFAPTWRRVMTDPDGFFAEMATVGGLRDPALFLVACAAVNALGHLLTGWGLPGMVRIFVAQVVAAFVGAAILVVVAQNLFDGRAGFEPTFRVVAYAAAPRVFLWVPILGPLALVYSAYLIVRGLERVQAIDAARAVLTVLVAVAVLWLLSVVRTGRLAWL
jgi:hypothetical protein